MEGKVCCFIGNSKVYQDISALLAEAVERHITEYGVTEFRVGNYGDFDRLAARAVVAAKARHPNVKLYLMLPYLPELGRPLPDMAGYDGSIYPAGMEEVPYKVAIPRLNRLMVQDSQYAIAYVRYTWGGSGKTMEYAQTRRRKGLLHVEDLARPADGPPPAAGAG